MPTPASPHSQKNRSGMLLWSLLCVCLLALSGCPSKAPQEPAQETSNVPDGGREGTLPESSREGLPKDVNIPENPPLPASILIIESGNLQRGNIDEPLLQPLTVRFLDRQQQPVADAEIVFSVGQGGGSLDGQNKTVTTRTDENGRASVIWKLGSRQGFQQQRVTAQRKGGTALPLTFVASGFRPGDPAKTAFSGIVIDNQIQPLAGVTVYLAKNNKLSAKVKTDKDGRFVLSGLQDFVGQAHLVVDGTTEGSSNLYPKLEYEVFNIAGIDNQLDGPAPLPRLDPTGSAEVVADKTTEVRPQQSPGLRMVIPAGAATFSDKKKSGTVNISRVDPYWLPMPLPQGYSSATLVTIQPADVRFDPPAPITFPNTTNIAAGAIVPIFSFDHAKGRYVKVADGRVSSDGKEINSLPGQGIVRGGWHGATQTISRQHTTVAGGKEDGNPRRDGTRARPGKGCKESCGDPVTPSDGAYGLSKTDLMVPARGLSFRFVRTYNSQFHYNGPLGYNWDHNYNIRLERLPNEDLILRNGFGRQDTFAWDAQNKRYTTPGHHYAQMVKAANGSFLLQKPNGVVYTFDENGFLRKLEDRFGNAMQFFYNLQRQLATVIDSVGRPFFLSYYEHGRVKAVSDFTGRRVSYTYDEAFNLVSVTTPATSRFPKGKTTRYAYSNGKAEASLNHNLLTITDPKGEVWLTNEYDDKDRISKQRWGTGEYTFAYEEQNPNADPKDLSIVRQLTTVTDPEKNVVKYHFNVNGNTVKKEVLTRKLRASDPAAWITQTTYNANGLPLKLIHPNGNSTEMTYDTSNEDRRAHANVLKIRRVSHRSEDPQKELIYTMTYEPRYQRLKTRVGPRGNCQGCDAKAFTTTYFYDYEEKTLGDLNGDGKTDGALGLLVKIAYPSATLSDNTTQKREMTFRYNAFGQRVEMTDLGGMVTRYEYYATNGKALDPTDQEGYLKQVTRDPGNLKLSASFAYDLIGNLTSATDPAGHITRYAYNARRQRIAQIAPAPFLYKRFFQYDENDNLVEIRRENVGPDGKKDLEHPWLHTRIKYNVLDTPIERQQEVAAGKFLTSKYEVDGRQRLIRQLDPAGKATCYAYDERGFKLSVTYGCGDTKASTVLYTYDGNGNLTELLSPSKERYLRFYDGFDRLVKARNPLDHTVDVSYDHNGNLLSVARRGDSGTQKDVLLAQAFMQYDQANRAYRQEKLFFATPGATKTERFVTNLLFDALGRPTQKTDVMGRSWKYKYDSAHRWIETTGPGGNITRTTYDVRSLPRESTQIAKSTKAGVADATYKREFAFDALGRMTQQTNQTQQAWKYAYDSRNKIRAITDPLGKETRYAYDGLGRLLTKTRLIYTAGKVSGQAQTRWEWADNGLMQAVIDANGNKSTYSYDALNRLSTMTYPTTKSGTSGSISLRYDANHRLIGRTDPNGSTFAYTYDAASRLTKVTVQKAAGVGGDSFFNFTYDGMHRLLSAENDLTKIQRTYDSLHRVTSETYGTQNLKMTYDKIGNLTSLTYPSGHVYNYTYNNMHLPQSITQAGQTKPLATFDYLGYRQLAIAYGNGTSQSRKIDNLGRLEEVSHADTQNKVIAGFSYRYNDLNLRLYRKHLHRNNDADVFRYDSLNRMISVRYGVKEPDKELTQPGSQNAARSVQYTLDLLGNRKEQTDGAAKVVYASNALNQFTKVAGKDHTYDKNGNLLDDSVRVYQYDAFNRLLQVQDKASKKVLVAYRYGPLGRRLEKQVGTVTTRYAFFGRQVIEAYDAQGKVLRRYLNGLGIDRRILLHTGGEDLYYHADERGTVHALTDSKGALREQYRYDAFGAVSIFSATGAPLTASAVGNPYLYTGRRYLVETGLYDYRNRIYHPTLGRFLQRDPKGYLDGMNLSLYVGHNPANLVDPFGLEGKSCENNKQTIIRDTPERKTVYLTKERVEDGHTLAGAAVTAVGFWQEHKKVKSWFHYFRALGPSPSYWLAIADNFWVPIQDFSLTADAPGLLFAGLSGGISASAERANPTFSSSGAHVVSTLFVGGFNTLFNINPASGAVLAVSSTWDAFGIDGWELGLQEIPNNAGRFVGFLAGAIGGNCFRSGDEFAHRVRSQEGLFPEVPVWLGDTLATDTPTFVKSSSEGISTACGNLSKDNIWDTGCALAGEVFSVSTGIYAKYIAPAQHLPLKPFFMTFDIVSTFIGGDVTAAGHATKIPFAFLPEDRQNAIILDLSQQHNLHPSMPSSTEAP